MPRSFPTLAALDSDGFQIARECCYKCVRPASHCYCALIEPFQAHSNLLILQHPHERRKYYSTARLVLRSITNSRMLQDVVFDEQVLKNIFQDSKCHLLYPGRDAEDCEQIPLSLEDTVIVLDGTWSEAGKLLHRNPLLKSLPKLSFKRNLRSEYRIRKQPKDLCLSTLESIAHLLKLNAAHCFGDKDLMLQKNYDKLFRVFNAMVEKQISHFPRMRESNSLQLQAAL